MGDGNGRGFDDGGEEVEMEDDGEGEDRKKIGEDDSNE